VDVLVDMLSYSDVPVEISAGHKLDEYAVAYAPPVEEFMIVKYEIPVGVKYELHETIAPTVIIVLGGEGFITVHAVDADSSETVKGNGVPPHMLPMSMGAVYYLQASRRHVVTSTGAFGFDSTDTPSPPLFFFRAGTNEAAISSDFKSNSASSCTVM
jgi:hypothetical protein